MIPSKTKFYQIKEIAPILFPEMAGKTNAELLEFCQEHSDRLRARWNDSGQTDFGIYQDPSYIFESMVSFYQVSKLCLAQFKTYLRQQNIDPKGKTYFELYNGIGINALTLTELGFDVVIHNDAAGQVESMLKLFKYYKLKAPKIVDSDWRKKQYDYVAAFEVLEHFKDPIEIARDLLKSVKPGGCLVESTGFKISEYPGHFHTYIINGQEIGGRQAATKVSKLYKQEGFEKIFDGYNRKPRIWQNVGVANMKKAKTIKELRLERIGQKILPNETLEEATERTAKHRPQRT